MPETRDEPQKTSGRKRRRRPFVWDLLPLLVVFTLMGAVYLLPPDTSLAQVRNTGTLKVCIPEAYPPLVTADAAEPGFDISLLQQVAERLGLKLTLNRNPQMGKDFNPRNWRVNRAQCEILAGGVVTSQTTRSFLETLQTGVETGWAVIAPTEQPLRTGITVGVYPGLGGLDRLGLSAYLRDNGMRGVLRPSLEALEAGLVNGDYEAAVTESLGARQLGKLHPDWPVAWMPASLGRYPMGLGLWKGDLTLKRALSEALDALEREGIVAQLQARYGIIPIEAVARLGQ